MQLKSRITRLEQHSPEAAKTPIYVVARLGEPLEAARARVFAERGLTDADDDRVIYVTWGRANEVRMDSE